MSMDFNDAGPQQSGSFEPIPEGTVAPVRLHLKGLKKSGSGATGLDIEYTVIAGPFTKRKTFAWTGVAGNGGDGHNKMIDISKSFIRAALESAYGINPADASAEARAARTLGDWDELDGIEFVARFRVEAGNEYTDDRTGEVRQGKAKNTLQAVTPDDPDYAGFKPAKPRTKGAASKPAAQSNGAAVSKDAIPSWAR